MQNSPNSFVTYRGMVMPKHCDHYGHLNVRYYAHFFDDGGFQMWHQIGIKQSDLTKDGMGTVVANITIDFIREIAAGQILEIHGAWTGLGDRSMVHEQRLYNADTGTHCATQVSTEVFFDMQKRQSAPMPADLKAIVAKHVVDLET